MIRLPATSLAVAKWAPIAAVMLALSCTSAQQVSQLFYPEPQWTTPLPPGVSSNPQEFRNSVASMKLRPSDSVHVRARAGTCPFCVVHVRIQAIGETWRIKYDSAPSIGVPVALIRNLDSVHTEARYGFRPDTGAVYYFWIDRRPGSTAARLTVLQVPEHGGSVAAGHQTNLRRCHLRRPGVPVTSDADFLEYKSPCDPSLAEGPARAGGPPISKASLFPGAPLVAIASRFAANIGRGMGVSQGGWIDCNSGCCR